MKDTYDFSKGRRGCVGAEPPLLRCGRRSVGRQGRLPNFDQFGAARIRRREDPEVGRDSPAHYPRGDGQEQRSI